MTRSQAALIAGSAARSWYIEAALDDWNRGKAALPHRDVETRFRPGPSVNVAGVASRLEHARD